MSVGSVRRARYVGPLGPAAFLVALLLIALGALYLEMIPESVELALRGDSHIVEQVLPRAQAGDPEAQHDLGLRYAGGRGVPQDNQRATEWYRAAAEQGYGPAQGSLGLAYYWGKGVELDHAKAAEWLRRAAEQNMAGSGYMLGLMHRSGEGVPKDYAKAAYWLQQAAELGNHYAQQMLAYHYRDGLGVAQNKVAAYKWIDLAIPKLKPSPARDTWIKMREQLGGTMTAEEVAQAERLARDWRPRQP